MRRYLVRAFYNEGARFLGYRAGDGLRPSIVAPIEIDAEDEYAAGEWLFEQLNLDWRLNGPVERSLSTGDVIVVAEPDFPVETAVALIIERVGLTATDALALKVDAPWEGPNPMIGPRLSREETIQLYERRIVQVGGTPETVIQARFAYDPGSLSTGFMDSFIPVKSTARV